MPTLESMYRRLLLTYPREYRRDHEEEILATLVDASEPGRRRPSLRETLGLLAGGLRIRAMLAAREGGRALWADGLRLGVLLLLLMRIGDYMPSIPGVGGGTLPLLLATVIAPVVLTLALVAVLRGGTWSSLVLLLLGGMASMSTSIHASTLMDFVSPAAPLLSPGSLLIALAAALLAALCSTRRTRRPWPGWVATLLAAPVLGRWALGWVSVHGHLPVSSLTIEAVAALVVPWALLVAAALIARDPRPSVAAAVYAASCLVPASFWVLADHALSLESELRLATVMLAVGLIATVATMHRGHRLAPG